MFERILLAVDGSAPSGRATEVAGDLALNLKAEVVVVTVREVEAMHAGVVELESSEEANELVDRSVRRLKDEGVSARGEVRSSIFGRAPRVILQVAEEADAGMIVMGSRGLSDLAGLVLGSVTHKVLHLAHVPVMVVR